MINVLFYFLIIFIIFIFAFFAEISIKKNKKIIFLVFSALAIIIPSLIAGFRASGVGTDTKVYVDWIFRENVRLDSFSLFPELVTLTNVEPLYCLVNYIVSRFSNSLTSIYFVLEFIILFFLYSGLYKLSKIEKFDFSFSLSYLFLLLYFYNKTFNLCRQSLAISICIFSLSYIINRNFKKFLLCMIIGFLFHSSTILFIPVYFLYNVSIKDDKNNKFIRFTIIAVLLLCALFFKQIVLLFVNLGIVSSKYLNYVYIYGNNSNIKFIEILSQFAILFLCIFFRKPLVLKNKNNAFIIFLLEIGFVLFLYGYNAKFSQRIAYYFMILISILLPKIISSFKKSKDQLAILLIALVMMSSYSYLYYGKYQFDQTVPYIYDNTEAKLVN